MSNANANKKFFKCFNLKHILNKLKFQKCNKKTLKNSLLHNIKEFSKNSTLHGLNYMVNKDLYPLER